MAHPSARTRSATIPSLRLAASVQQAIDGTETSDEFAQRLGLIFEVWWGGGMEAYWAYMAVVASLWFRVRSRGPHGLQAAAMDAVVTRCRCASLGPPRDRAARREAPTPQYKPNRHRAPTASRPLILYRSLQAAIAMRLSASEGWSRRLGLIFGDLMGRQGCGILGLYGC